MYRIKMSCDARQGLRRMDNMKDAATDFRMVFIWAQRELGKMNRENFAASGLPVGGWSPLKPRYASWKIRNFPGAPIMVQTGKLFNAVGAMNGAGSYIRKTTSEFVVDIEYASFHQYGTSKMAKRQIVMDTPLFAQSVADKAKEHIVNAANNLLQRVRL